MALWHCEICPLAKNFETDKPARTAQSGHGRYRLIDASKPLFIDRRFLHPIYHNNMSSAEEYTSTVSRFPISINRLPDDKILDWSKLKQIADDILKCILK